MRGLQLSIQVFGQPLHILKISLFQQDRCSWMLMVMAQGSLLNRGPLVQSLAEYGLKIRDPAPSFCQMGPQLRQLLSGPEPGARRACHLSANARSMCSALLKRQAHIGMGLVDVQKGRRDGGMFHLSESACGSLRAHGVLSGQHMQQHQSALCW